MFTFNRVVLLFATPIYYYTRQLFSFKRLVINFMTLLSSFTREVLLIIQE